MSGARDDVRGVPCAHDENASASGLASARDGTESAGHGSGGAGPVAFAAPLEAPGREAAPRELVPVGYGTAVDAARALDATLAIDAARALDAARGLDAAHALDAARALDAAHALDAARAVDALCPRVFPSKSNASWIGRLRPRVNVARSAARSDAPRGALRVARVSAAAIAIAIGGGCGAGAGAARSAADEPVMFEDEAAARSAPRASEGVERGEALLAQGQTTEAEAAFRAAIEADPRDARAHLDLGLALEMQERLEDAERAYRRAIEVDPNLAEAHNNLGVLLRDTERTTEALAALRQAIRVRPAFASAHLNLGLALEDAGDATGAMASYRRVIEIAPQEPTSRVQLGLLQLAAGERDQAVITLRRAVPLARGDRALLSALGNGLRRAGDPSMAVRVLREAIAASDEAAPPAVIAELALAQFAAEHADEAERTLRELLTRTPDYAVASYLLANMLASRQAYAEAARFYQEYLRREPQGPHAAQARERLAHVRRLR